MPVPDWPEPSTAIDPQFVHYFGKICERIRDPDEAWPDESKYCRARRGLRFDRLETRHAGLPNRRFCPQCAFRRLFCDGQAVVRIEIGIAHKHSEYPLEYLGIEEVITIAQEIAEIPTIVHDPLGDARFRPILAQGKHLARLYTHASVARDTAEPSLGLQLVEAGDPIILVELKPHEANLTVEALRSEGLIEIDKTSVNGAIALFCRLSTSAGFAPMWILQKGTATVGQLRSLRLCLTRLHAEREVLDLILKQIHRRRLLNPPTEETVDLLDRYFNERLKLINRKNWGGMKQSEILAAFDATREVIQPAAQAQLISRYQGCRKQVWKKIERFQEQRRAIRIVPVVSFEEGAIDMSKHVNVSGTGNIVNVAEYMTGVKNTVNNNLAESETDPQIKALIKQLSEEIQRVAPKVDPGQIKKMGKNLEALSKEVASDEPERRWYEVSLDGIKEAAVAVGEIATPILTTVGKLASILLA